MQNIQPGLAPTLRRDCQQRQTFLTEQTADLYFSVDYPVPPSRGLGLDIRVPEKRNIVMPGVHWFTGDRPLGRGRRRCNKPLRPRGKGEHGSDRGLASIRIFDRRNPMIKGKKIHVETDRFELLPDGGTRSMSYAGQSCPCLASSAEYLRERDRARFHALRQMLMQAAKLAGEEYLAAAGRE